MFRAAPSRTRSSQSVSGLQDGNWWALQTGYQVESARPARADLLTDA
ncbi:hypothetical protein RISK_000797 [Rhodopirellula islandica]|uniref:Uncharacterized protein n=1 Tax=Rhodopirellula islandica TaxID=595434 RepID=A0A0J1BKE0_RHOIS|nr:hypothetical protein RISK_000797 [Rhodopirellula islandica]